MYEQTAICKRCASSRNVDMHVPCEMCGSRQSLFGYLYEHEIQQLTVALIIISAVLLLAIITGAVYLFLKVQSLNQRLSFEIFQYIGLAKN